MRKQSPPSWTKLGNDIITAAATNSVDLANTVATTAAAVVAEQSRTEQSRSFFDFSLRDFGKQVFRQNLSFGNEPVTSTASTSTATMSTSSALNVQPTASENVVGGRTAGEFGVCGCVGTTTGCLCSGSSSLNTEYSADCIPTDVKQEIKENISPEHTINEETLHTMQKLCGSSAAMTPANLESNDDKQIFINTMETSTAPSAVGVTASAVAATVTTAAVTAITPQPPPTITQIQHSNVAAASGIESELPAHNT